MNEEKRQGDSAIPQDVKGFLNNAQLAELHHIERFGWILKYIRRPLFQEPVVVVVNPDGSSIGVLEEDGRLNLEPGIDTRE
ncbi:MAG: hypothetical protein OEY78_04495 [Gammaproteobacteria bacterium]|nr:hypothetical protein [Gammaproteobacteria bacterium]